MQREWVNAAWEILWDKPYEEVCEAIQEYENAKTAWKLAEENKLKDKGLW